MERLPTPVFSPAEYHGVYSPWDRKESDMTEWLSLFIHPCAVVTLPYNLLFMHLFPWPHCEFIDCSVSLESSPGLPDSRLSGLWNGWRKVKRAIKERETTGRERSCGTQGNNVQIKAREVKSLIIATGSYKAQSQNWSHGLLRGMEGNVGQSSWSQVTPECPRWLFPICCSFLIFVSPCRKDIPQEGPDVRGALHR